MKDGEFTKSIGRFVDLVAEFGDRIGELHFVSNTDFDTVTSASRDDKRRGRCPRLFLECIRGCRSRADIALPFDGTFDELLAECSCDPDDLVAVLQRVNLILGPSRSEFDAALSHEHLAQLGDCRSYNAQQLDSLRNNLVAVVYRASSLQVTDPIRHLRPMIDAQDPDPALSAKRIVVAEVEFFLSQTPSNPVFCFPDEPVLERGRGLSGVIEQKLAAAGHELEIDYLCDRARAAEYNLLEDVVRRPEAFPKLLRQIEQRVHGEVSEAHLHARQQPAPYGPTMLMEVQNRLRHLAVDRPADVGYHGYECLIGVAGLLTDECRVWWGPRFPIRVEAIS